MSDYSVIVGAESPGCMVDSSIMVINGSFVCGDEFIAPGKIVRLSHITNGYKIASINGDLVIGVAVRPLGSCIYEDGDPVSVVSRGIVWCLTSESEAPEYGDKVFVTQDGDAAYSEGDLLIGWIFTGEHVKVDHDSYIVGVSINA
ncbi:hypothetical protein H1N79_gp84 [Escherichia phage tonn]|uniref:Uncharacterized protein n=1 Tax=Escherichia phage tonn TaxID=2696451 RepID=A0A6B9WZG3_9CAUD|nr:hypothetical protein H1N79_gp84 [Escherichia phage tonn]QHR69115.1 hypothetical protein tonn_84 [Escherichia phage tonn]